jgi:hypothetical protein
VKATRSIVEGNMGKFKVRIVNSNLEENSCLNAYVLLRRESIEATPDPLLSLALLRDEQRLSLGELLTVVNTHYKPSMNSYKCIKMITNHSYRV